MIDARITGDVLRWARERRELKFEDVASGTHAAVGDLVSWENGSSFPAFSVAENLAHYLRIPFGFLFLSRPPIDAAPIPDFRTVSGNIPRGLSPDFLEVLNDVRLKQDWYREYGEQNLAGALPFVGSRRMAEGTDVVAADISKELNVGAELRKRSRDWATYLSALCNAAQRLGILVMRSGIVGSDSTRALDVEEFRGFALSDRLAPIVFINSKDAKSAQIFTLVHEIAHIWIDRSGISNPDPSGVPKAGVESFCNRVAADVLLPAAEFAAEFKNLKDKSKFPEELSRQFWVSPLVVIRRAFDIHRIGQDEFYRLVRAEKNKKFKKRTGSGGNPIRTLLARNSHKFTEAILNAVREDRLTYRDGARLLGTSNKFFPELLRKSLE